MVGDIGHQRLAGGDIGRIAEDEVKGRFDPLAPVTRTESSAIGHAQRLGIGARIAERRLARIDAKPACSGPFGKRRQQQRAGRSEEHTSELQSLMRISYAVFCLKKKKQQYKYTPKLHRMQDNN